VLRVQKIFSFARNGIYKCFGKVAAPTGLTLEFLCFSAANHGGTTVRCCFYGKLVLTIARCVSSTPLGYLNRREYEVTNCGRGLART